MSLEDKLYPYLKYYQKLPNPLMGFAGKVYSYIPTKLRYGRVFDYYYNLIPQSQYFNDLDKENYIKNQLKKTIDNAYYNTNYYKKVFDSIKLKPESFGDLDAFRTIPFTDKEILRNNKKDIMNYNINKKNLLYTTTGGTSGIPVEVFFIKGVERSREFAFMNRQWERVGYRFGDRVVVLRGTVVNNQSGSAWYKYEPIKNRLLLSNFDLTEKNIYKYVKRIKDFAPKYIHTYPSAISVIAKFILDNNLVLEPINAVFCSSEQFYPGQRELIEEAFKTRVYSWYGHTESGTLAGECEYSNDYHIFYEYGYTELVDEKGNIITEEGKIGEIVCTSFEMLGFPIIRYRTGDYAEYSDNKCKCGRNYTLIKNVKGRWTQEFIFTKDNSKISLTALNMHTDIFDNVYQYQFYQKVKGELILKIIPSNNYSQEDTHSILKDFREKFRDKVHIEIQIVDKIQKTNSCKHKFLIQEIIE